MSERLTRRQLLALGAAGAGALGVGAAGLLVGEAASPFLTDESSSEPKSSDDAWFEPSVLSSAGGVLAVELRVAEREVLIGERRVRMLSYNGTVPGPTLHLRPGDTLRVRLRNELAVPTNLHTHGLHVSAAGNGDNPFLSVGPGESFEYEFALRADHPSGVFWYHPHRHGSVADQLFGGLSGAIVVDRDEWGASAPRVAVVSDVTFSGGAVAAASAMERMIGRNGETVLVNGRISPVIESPAGSRQRLLVINACASRYLDLRLRGLDARVRAIDSRLHAERGAERVVLAPGNRLDVVVATPREPTELRAVSYDRGCVGMGAHGSATAAPTASLLTIRPVATAPSAPVADAVVESVRDLRQAPVDRRRVLTLDMGAGMGMFGARFVIDGREFDERRVDQRVDLGAIEEWTIRNRSSMDHPFHLHVWPMQLVRLGGRDVESVEFRDVVDVPAGGEVVVRIAFDRFPGRTVYHCHILDHEDLGMMGVVEVA